MSEDALSPGLAAIKPLVERARTKLGEAALEELMRRHYTEGHSREAVDRWYAARVAKVLRAKGIT